MSVELSLLNAVIAKSDFSLLVRQGLSDDDAWHEQIDAYRFIRKHVEEFGETPSVESVIRACPTFEATDVVESPETLAAKLHERNVKLEERRILEEAARRYSTADGYELMQYLQERLEALRQRVAARMGAGVANWTKASEQRKEQYEKRKNGEDRTVVPLFWPAIDDAVGGFVQGRDMVVIIAKTKIGKTWLAKVAGLNANRAGFRVLEELAESDEEEAYSRLETLDFGVSNRGLFAGRLSEEEEERYYACLDELAKSGRPDYVIRTPKDWPLGLTLQQLEADIRQFRPDVVIVDQFNLMRFAGPTREDKANMSRALKLLFARLGVIGVIVTQANGDYIKRIDRMEDEMEGEEVRELNPPREGDYSETVAVLQDCTKLIALDAITFRDPTTGKERGKALARVEISRTGGAGTEVSLEWCPNDGVIRPRTPTDVF